MKAGYKDHQDITAAQAAGFTDAVKWRQDVAKREKAKSEAALAAENARYEATRDPSTRMSMPNMTWSTGGFGSIGIVTVTIDNANDFAVKDIGIECRFSGKSGTLLTTATHRIYDTIQAKSKRTFKEVNVGFINSQSARGGCNVETARRL